MATLSEEEFIDIVKQAELDAEAKPRLYALKLMLFAVLGYVVILILLFTLFGLAGGVIATAFFSTGVFLLLLKKKLLFLILAGIWVLLRALWVRFTPPQGLILKREDYPALFSEIDNLKKQLKSLKIHKVILDNSLNAAVVQHPRLGILGWHKNYLILGYQLLLTLSPEEMRSVLAHEIGHLSGNHCRFSGWIYRVRLSWMRIMEALEQVETLGASLLLKFFRWYSPRFEAHSFALARRNEYDADSISAELTSAEIAGKALVNVYATAPFLDQHYWDAFIQNADKQEKPPHAPFEGLARFIADDPISEEVMQERVQKEMAVETHYADTHPSLKDRIKGLGASMHVPVLPKTSAAEIWLGEQNSRIMEHFDREWLNENQEEWNKRHAYVQNAKSKLQSFSQMPLTELSHKELWEYATWSREFASDNAALLLFRAFQERYPEDPGAAFFIGSILLSQGDSEGLEQLRQAREGADYIEQAARAGYSFLKDLGRDNEAETWWQESLQKNEIFIAAYDERNNITIDDSVVSPKISDELLEQLLAGLKEHKKVGKAWLAEKVVENFPDDPVYIVAFSLKGFTLSASGVQKKVAEALQVNGNVFIVCKSGEAKKIARKVIKSGRRIL
jgi:Zn-dependent protease with chaperone function